MNKQLIFYFVDGFRLIVRNVAVLIPVVVVYTVDLTAEPIFLNAPLAIGPFDTIVVLFRGHIHLILYSALLLFSIKAILLILSNKDMNLAFEGRSTLSRYKASVQISLLHSTGAFVVALVLWHSAFALIGLLGTWSVRPLTPVVQWAVVSVAFVLLWPVYYAGVSLSGFVIANWTHERFRLPAVMAVVRENLSRVYYFYVVRSVVDAALLFILPLVLFRTLGSGLLVAVASGALVVVAIGWVRASSIRFKRSLFRIGRRNKNG